MKNTKVQNRRRIPRIKPKCGHTSRCSCTPRSVVAASRASCIDMCLVWGKAEPAIRPSRTILHDALNEQTASTDRSCFMPLSRAAPQVYKNACPLCIILMDWVTQRGPRRYRFLDPERRLFSEIATLRLRVSVPPTHVCAYGRPYRCMRNAVQNFHVNF